MITTPLHRRRDLIETVELGSLTEDASLSNIYLGIAYTRNRARTIVVAQDEMDEERLAEEEWRLFGCLVEAVCRLEQMGMMEGLWEVGDRGVVTFKVWRID